MVTALCIAAVLVLNLLGCALLATHERRARRRRADLLTQVVQHPQGFAGVWTLGADRVGDARLIVQDLSGRSALLADGLEYDTALARLHAAGVGVHGPVVPQRPPAQDWTTDPRAPSLAFCWAQAAYTLPVRDGVAGLEPAYRRAMFAATPQAPARPAAAAPAAPVKADAPLAAAA